MIGRQIIRKTVEATVGVIFPHAPGDGIVISPENLCLIGRRIDLALAHNIIGRRRGSLLPSRTSTQVHPLRGRAATAQVPSTQRIDQEDTLDSDSTGRGIRRRNLVVDGNQPDASGKSRQGHCGRSRAAASHDSRSNPRHHKALTRIQAAVRQADDLLVQLRFGRDGAQIRGIGHDAHRVQTRFQRLVGLAPGQRPDAGRDLFIFEEGFAFENEDLQVADRLFIG